MTIQTRYTLLALASLNLALNSATAQVTQFAPPAPGGSRQPLHSTHPFR
jgi:hypothetical protein